MSTQAVERPSRRSRSTPASGGLVEGLRLPRDAWLGLAACATLFAGHLAYGGLVSQPALLMMGAAAALLIGAFAQPRLRKALAGVRGLALPGGLFLGVAGVALWTQTPYVPGGPHPVWAYLGFPPALTVDRSTTFIETVKLLGLGCFFLLGVLAGQDDDRGRFTLRVLVWAGVAFALWALIAGASGLIYQTQKPRIEAMFLSPNTAGTLFAALLAISLGEVFRRRTAKDTVSGKLVAAGASLALAFCLLATASRGAALSALVAGAAFILLLAATGILRLGRVALATLGGIAVLLLVLGLSGDQIIARFYDTEHSAIVRQAIWAPHWQAFLDSPLFGYGLGNYETVNKTVLSTSNWDVIWNVRSAHNVYLQWLEEAGIVGAAPMFLAIGAVMLATLRGALTRSRMKAALCALLAADLVFLAHGVTDFALQTPSVAATFALLLGLQFSLAQSSQQRGARPSIATPVAYGWPVATLLLVVASLWGLTSGAARAGPFSLPFAAALDRRAEALLAGSPAPGPAQRLEAQALSARAVRQYPYDTSAWLRLAYVDVQQHGRLTPAGAAALQRSYDLVPADTYVGVWRVGFALEHTSAVSKSVRVATLEEAALLWREPRRRKQLEELPQVLKSRAGRLAATMLIASLKAGATY